MRYHLMNQLTRRRFLAAAGTGTGVAIAACAPAAAPQPPGQPSPSGAAGSGWEAEWERLVAGARQEGQLAVVSLTGLGYRKTLDRFEEAFPGVRVELQSFSSASQIAPRVEKERQAGLYSWDIALINTTTALKVMHPYGAWDPIRNAIFRPDVMDDKNWADGFEAGFVDNDRKWTYSFTSQASEIGINTDLVKEGDLKHAKDLLDPKWRGRIQWGDVRWGGTYWPMTAVRLSSGDEAVKGLIVEQQPVFLRETRQMAENFVKGGIAIANAQRNVMRDFWDQGVGKNIKYMQLAGYSYVSGHAFFLFNRAAHPNAAKLFVNWLLTREGQTVWSTAMEENSRRTDVPAANPSTLPVAGWKYTLMHAEATLPEVETTQELLTRLVGISN